jgi:6,7-dimethyl-8-ribityllumazine synthase
MAGPLKSGKVKSEVNLSKKKFAIVVAEWNEEITEALYEGAVAGLTANGVKKAHIIRKNVPGTFELSLGALWMGEKKDIDAVICLGCVIQGETPHFDYICQGVSYGVTEAALKTRKPVIFGVLTTLNKQQALDRAGGKYGNKGEEAALTAIGMLNF